MNIHQIAEVMETLYTDYGYCMLIPKNDEILNTEILDCISEIQIDKKEDYYSVYFTELLENICQNNHIKVRACSVNDNHDYEIICSFVLEDKTNGEIVFRLNMLWYC